MFKKLKDKLTEEVKIPSQKFTQSMQQLAQAVVSPGSNNNSAAFDTASNDNFSIDGDFDDTPQASPVKSPSSEGGVAYRGGQATPLRNSFDGAGFTHVDLQQDTSTPKMPASLRSSVSSLASDSSFMFPVLESSGPTYNFQSDLESCSEASESVGPNINKEQLLVAYQKIQQKYHKYKGRYSDLARHYRDLERDNKNAKHILTDCQDKALRRMAELKEQCNLEKQAKAHLEEALRSDLEEKDHLIHTLKTKIKLLRNQADQVQGGQPDEKSSAGESSEASDENSTKSTVQEDLLTGADSGPGPTTPVTVLTPEPANSDDSALKEKVKKLESLLHKCKEDITNKRETIKQLESDKITAHSKLEAMLQQLAALKKREEEASLSLAKNKQTIHQELESKEDEIKKLNAQLTSTNTRVSELQAEIAQIREDSKKEVATCKMQATKQMKTELDGILAQKKTLEECLETRESEHKAQEEKISELMKRLVEHEAELQLLKAAYKANEEKHSEETKILNEEILKLQDCQKIGAGQENNVEKFKEILKTIQELHGIHKQLKTDVSKTQVDNMDLIRQQAQLIQDKIGTVMSDLTEEHKKVLVELDEYKKESVSARESLASVSNKFERLQQSLQTEKGEIEKKMSNLKKELDTNKTQISSLEENLASERSNHQVTQSEYSKKMAALQKELNDEKNRNNEFLEGTSSVELQMKSSIDELNNQVKLLEEEKVKIAGDYESMKERTNTLQITNDQLHQELEILKTQERESINKMTSMQMLVDEKNALLETLESSIEELELKAASLTAEKLELEEKWTVQEAELASQISQISSKYQKATDTIKDLQDKMSHAAGENDEKYTSLLQENEKRESQLAELQTRLQNSDAEVAQTISKNAELQKQINDLLQKFQDQDSIMTTLKETNETLSQSVQQLQDDHQVKAVRIKDLESSSAELERITSEKLQQSGDIARFEKDLAVKTKECTDIRESLESANAACSELKELLSSKSKECNDLTLEINRLTLAHSEEIKALQEKSDNCARLTSELESSEVAKSQLRSSLEQKIEECERLQTQLFEMDKKQVKDSEEHAVIAEKQSKLKEVISDLENDRDKLNQSLQSRNEQVEKISSELEDLRKNLTHQSKILQEKTTECNDLECKLKTLTSNNEKITQLLKQKTIECEDKEAQLDNLADEMKRVEELSQELHRINDDRDANVEVLSTEASSLAQKVEELTISTQELKEREVDLLGKLQVARDLEAEYISMKQREEMLLSELKELQNNEEVLTEKNKQIEELIEENKKLKDAGQNLDDIIQRARDAEAKCEKLQNDGAGLLLRIQKAEESEIRCSFLEEELESIKKEKAELSQEVEMLQSKTVFKETTSDKTSNVETEEPAIEEPCIAKHFADLTENNQGGEWKEKYNKLLQQHQIALQENAATIERLKEENLLAASGRRKERLWDPQEAIPDGNSNGSFGAVEKLQQQLATATTQLKESKRLHRQEVDDLRRILLNHGSSNSHSSSRSDNLEDATELEYLRNILYEYMMGKEPMILARVIAAVVKFDSEQTSKVLQKEQQRLSLLGHLGIS